MNDEELSKSLVERKAVVVHFSHHANMRDGGIFPNDLQDAIAKKDKWPLSCSVLWPAHSMEPCGSVGVMFKPTATSVISVSNKDSGSRTDDDGQDHSDGKPLTHESFAETFQVVGTYNEWRVRGAEVAGIFVLDTCNIEVKKWCDVSGLPGGQVLRVIGSVPIHISEVFSAFPNLPVFTLRPQGIFELARP